MIKQQKVKKKKKGNQVEPIEYKNIWRMKDGYGKLNFIYAATFDGLNLISLKPKEFEHVRLKNFESSMDNPHIFNEFFQQQRKIYRKSSLFQDIHSIDVIVNNLLDSDNPISTFKTRLATSSRPSLARNFTVVHYEEEKEEEEEKKRIQRKQKNEKNFTLNISKEEDLMTKMSKNQSKPIKDFDYTSLGIFFKADFLIYQQDKELILEDELESNEPSLIGHFFTFSGCKLLITFDLKNIMKNLINSHTKSKKVIKIDKPHESQNQFTNQQKSINFLIFILI